MAFNTSARQNSTPVSDEIALLNKEEETSAPVDAFNEPLLDKVSLRELSDVWGQDKPERKQENNDEPTDESLSKKTPADENFSLNIDGSGNHSLEKDTKAALQRNDHSGESDKDANVLIYTMPRQFIKGKAHLAKSKKHSSLGQSNSGSESSKSAHTVSGKRRAIVVTLSIAFAALVATAGVLGYVMFFKKQSAPLPAQNTPTSEVAQPQIVEQAPANPASDTNNKPQTETGTDGQPANALTGANPLEPLLGADLIQKPVVSYDDHGAKTTAAVLSIEKEPAIKYSQITIQDHIADKKPEFFVSIVGAPYEVRLRGEKPSAKAVLTITYPHDALAALDVIPADVRIGFMPFDRLDEILYRAPTLVASTGVDGVEETANPAVSEQKAAGPLIWEILKAHDVDGAMNSISSVLDALREGVYALVPLDINSRIELPEAPKETQPPIESEPVFGQDFDADMLTDKEELLYGTSPSVADSDGDEFKDGEEVLKLFSPARGSGVRLEEDAQFSSFVNSASNFTFLYPRAFTVSSLQEGSSNDTLFSSKDNETILVSVQDNAGKLALQEWLVSISPNINPATFQSFATLSGYAALQAPNKTTYYVQIPDAAYVIVFSYISPAEYSYGSTERMMVESVVVQSKKSVALQ